MLTSVIIQTLVVYLLTFSVLIYSSYLYVEKNVRIYLVLGLLFYSLIMGLRYGVGADFFQYYVNYNLLSIAGWTRREDYELGFFLLMNLCVKLGFSASFFLGFIAFLQITLVLYSLRKYWYIYPFLLFAFCSLCVWLSYANGLRQTLAFCIIINALVAAYNRNFYIFIIEILLAYLFHTSAIFMFVLYFVVLKKGGMFNNISIQLAVLAVSLVLINSNIITNFLGTLENVITLLGLKYGTYFEDRYSHEIVTNSTFGLGALLSLLIDLSLIIKSKKIKVYFSETIFPFVYDLFYIGLIWKYLFYNTHIFARFNYYFYGFEFVCLGFALYYFKKFEPRFFLVISSLVCCVFVAYLYKMQDNTLLYIFNWQDYYYVLKSNML